MKKFLFIVLFGYSFIGCQAQKITNKFFALHNIIRGDSTYDTFDKQVELIKKVGFDGIEINQVESFKGLKEALDKHRFEGAYFYVKVKLEEPFIDPRLKDYIKQLRGTETIIAPYIVSESKRYKPSSKEADTLAIRLIHQVADWAQAANLQVAIYPHVNFYLERTDHALALVKKINRKNVGLSFNLCHWLATTNTTERDTLNTHLQHLAPYLKMITISGANNVVSNQQPPWSDYILPLGKGSFDTYALLKYMIKGLKFKGPIGVQCYNIKGDKPSLAQNTIEVLKEYKSRLSSEK
jgi:sugar phosphate isomerase/epimerase